jgi:hypothetical protein
MLTPSAVHVIEPLVQKGVMDCGLVALAALTGKSYREVSDIALQKAPTAHTNGLWLTQLKVIAKALGFTLVKRVPPTWDDESGLLDLRLPKNGRHYAILFQGVLINPADGLIWDLGTYLATKKASITALYEVMS